MVKLPELEAHILEVLTLKRLMLMCWSVNMLFDSLKINNNHNFDFGHLLLDLVLFVCLFVFRKKQQKANNTQKIVIERQQIIN